MLQRLVRADSYRKSRLHDEKGHLIDARGLAYAPYTLWLGGLRLMTGYRPAIPWLSYRAIHVLDRLIQPHWRALEFGSGMSTPWLARRCAYLHSIESDERWHGAVRTLLQRTDPARVRYELRGPEGYSDLSAYAEGAFDFVLVDGIERAACVASALPHLRPGGWLYLDNSDKDMQLADGDTRRAEAQILAAVAAHGGSIRYFHDFSPGRLVVSEGLLVRL